MTDFVVTYVDGNDPEWFRGYSMMCSKHGRIVNSSVERYRDWGFLRYVLRGVASFMPWIRNCYLVVERQSQVPKWVNRETVDVITHDMIIPEEHRPTYNSTTIELFLCRIPGLANQFIYANDDMIPIGPLSEDDFYDNGKPKLKVITAYYHDGMNLYRHHLHNGEALARAVLELPENGNTYTKTGHNLNPMLRSTWDVLWEKGRQRLEQACSPFRFLGNINQDVCSYYQILSGNYTESERRTAYKEMDDMRSLTKFIDETDVQLICINDNGSDEFEEDKKQVLSALERKIPDKSKYEA